MTTHSHRLPNGTVPVLLSADAPESIPAEAAALLAYVTDHPGVAPHAIADMLFRTRTPRRHRALCMVGDGGGLTAALESLVDGHDHRAVVRTTAPVAGRVGFVFPGQGSQRPGMGRSFYDAIPAFRAAADRCAASFTEQFDTSPLAYLLDDGLPADDSAAVVQPALFTQMVALAEAWRSFGVEPEAVVGHSQGELAAAYVAGAMTLSDAVRVVGVRAQAADGFLGGEYAMAVVAASREECEDVLARAAGWTQLSVVNSPSMVGISGERCAIDDLVALFTERGVFARVIRVRYPAHTLLINDIGARVRTELHGRLDNSTFLDTEIPVLGATLGGPITDDLPVDDYWFLNLRNTVRFDRAIAAAAGQDVDAFIELAEHPTLQLAVQENLAATDDDRARVVIGTSVRDADHLDEFTRNLALAAVALPHFEWSRLGVEVDGAPPPPLRDFPNSILRQTAAWLPYPHPSLDVEPAVAPAAPPLPNPLADDVRAPRLLLETWPRLASRSLASPRALGIVDHTGGFADLVAELCSSAATMGATARPVSADDTEGIDTLVVLLPPATEQDDESAAAAVGAFFGRRSWWPHLTEGIRDCWLLTFGGEVVLDDDAPPDPVSAAVGAGFRSIGAEHAGVRFGHLDVAGTTPGSALTILSALHTEGESELALRAGAVHAKRVVDVPAPGPIAAPRHALIVGGTGKVGLEFCEHLARGGAQRVTLLNRSGETAELTRRLNQIRSDTATSIEVRRCDLGDRAAVARLVEENRASPADLVVHCAVTYTGDELNDITPERMDVALRGKVIGVSALLDAFPRTSACRVLLCSSVAANVGGRGMIAYAASNRMLEAMAIRWRRDGMTCVAVQWGQWAVTFDVADAGTAKLGVTGLVPMDARPALQLGLTELPGNAIVAAFDLGRARSMLGVCGRDSLLAELHSASATPEVRADDRDASRRFLTLLAGTIGLGDADAIDQTVPLVAIGLDSLQALEVRRLVKAEFDHELEVAELLGGATVEDVLAQLV